MRRGEQPGSWFEERNEPKEDEKRNCCVSSKPTSLFLFLCLFLALSLFSPSLRAV